MDADVDVDVTLHLGAFKNLGLFSRGLYFVRASLCYGSKDNRLAPMGFFSAPRAFMSSVDGQEVAQPRVREWMHVCKITDAQDAFETRVFSIRFKDERVELNCGVHFRVQVQDVRDVAAGVTAPFQIIFELVHSKFNEPKHGETSEDVDSLVPEDPVFTVVSSQSVKIGTIAGNFHEYFPVTFDRMHFCQLDAMAHVAVSAIRYHWISFAVLPSRVSSGRRWPPIQPKDPTAVVDLKAGCNRGESGSVGDLDGVDDISAVIIDDAHFGVEGRKPSTAPIVDPGTLLYPELSGDSDDATTTTTTTEERTPSPGIEEVGDVEVMAASGVPLQQLLELACVYLSPLEGLINSVTRALEWVQGERSRPFDSTMPARGRRATAPDITGDRVQEFLANVVRWLPGKDLGAQLRRCKNKGIVKSCIRDFAAHLSTHCAVQWNRFVTMLPLEEQNILFEMRRQWLQDAKLLWRQRCIVDTEAVASVLRPQHHCTAHHQPVAEFIRRHIKEAGLQGSCLIDLTMFPDENTVPIAYLQQYATDEELQQLPREPVLGAPLLRVQSPHGSPQNAKSIPFWRKPKQVFVLVHGFMGNAFDMYLIKNYLLLAIPDAIVCCSEVNESNTSGRIAGMAAKLAEEVASFITARCPSLMHPESDDQLTFIGHSIGGLIIRAALQEPALEPCRARLHAFVTLSTPHLGTLLAQSQLVATGMWALLKLKKAPILSELRLEDASKFENCYLYRLNQGPSLQWFKHVIFVSSHNDGYVPFQSARAQVMPDAEADSTATSAAATKFKTLASMLLDSLGGEPTKLVRVDVEHRTHVSVDSIIGRAAHIQYLEEPAVACQLVFTLLPYLDIC